MQLKLDFVLSFESDWHINAGFGADGKADAVLERDPQGKPVVSGTTLKGVFRDALYDLALNLGKDPDSVTVIFGAPGHDSHWRFSAATSQAKNIRESTIITGVRVDPRYRRAEDNKYFKRELGAAEIFTFSVTGTAADDSALEEVEWLVAAASYIERLGGRRRRGNGKCIISLSDQDLHEELLKSFENRHCGGTHQITDNWKSLIEDASLKITPYHNPSRRYRIILYTERPVIIAEKPEAGNVYQGQIIIPGSTLRGAFAELVRPNDLDDASYERFKKLFILGGLKFSHLNPLDVKDGIGIPVAKLPLGLQQVEDSQDTFTSVFQKLSEQKAFSSWGYLQERFQKVSYNTNSHPHVRIDPDLKRASDGDLYTYEAIPAGRYYTGELYLSDDDWRSIGELLRVNINEPFELRIGKGRNRSYGQVKVVILPMSEDEPPAWIHAPLEKRLETTPVHELYITLATDTIVQDPWGRFYGRFESDWLAHELQMPDVQIMAADEERPAQVVRTKLIESFDARSGLPRWRDKALIAGSTAHLVFANGKRPDPDILKQLENEGIGLRRGEGFGRVIFNHPAHTGQWSEFAEVISIPQELLAAINVVSERSAETQEDFTQRWKRTIYAEILGITSESICRSLARQLMEYVSIDALLEKFEAKSNQKAEKSSHEDYQKAVSIIVGLLNRAKDEGENRRKAVILLAEALLNNREKA